MSINYKPETRELPNGNKLIKMQIGKDKFLCAEIEDGKIMEAGIWETWGIYSVHGAGLLEMSIRQNRRFQIFADYCKEIIRQVRAS